MSNRVLSNIARFIILVLLQGLVFQNINLWGQFIIYPLFLFLLPYETPKWALILLGFFLGITIDLFYNSIGVHAAAGVLTGTIRPFILKIQEPKGGYPQGQSPTRYRLGTALYFRYTGTLLLIHLFWYYSMEIFSIVELPQILLSTLISFLFSMGIIAIHAYLINPKN